MQIHLLYVGVDAAVVTLGLAIAVRVLSAAPRNRNAWLIALLVLGAIANVMLSRQDYSPLIPPPYQADFGAWRLFLNLSRNLGAGVFMLLCHGIFREDQRLPRTLIALVVLQVLLEEPLEWLLGATWLAANPSSANLLAEVLPACLQILFLGFALYWMLADRQADLVEQRRTARTILMIVFVAQVVLALLVERIWFGIGGFPVGLMYPTHVLVTGIAALTLLFVAVSMMRTDVLQFIDPQPRVPVPTGAPEGPADTTEADLARVRAALDEECIYRHAGLTVGALARQLGIPEYRLRKLIHDHLGYRNFNALLHDYRVADVCDALSDPEQDGTPVLTLALAAGYQSINPFNRAFRELTGITPTAFRRQAHAKPPDD